MADGSEYTLKPVFVPVQRLDSSNVEIGICTWLLVGSSNSVLENCVSNGELVEALEGFLLIELLALEAIVATELSVVKLAKILGTTPCKLTK